MKEILVTLNFMNPTVSVICRVDKKYCGLPIQFKSLVFKVVKPIIIIIISAPDNLDDVEDYRFQYSDQDPPS